MPSDEGGPRSVLIVDDELDLLAYLSAVLEDAGFEVLAAETAPEAVRLVREHRPGIICLDVVMPRTLGMSLYCDLRKMEQTKGVPIVFVSGVEPAATLRRRFRKLVPDRSIPPPDGYFEKPIEPGGFVESLNRLLAERKRT